MNKNTNQFFDLAVWDIGTVIPRYIDEDTCEQDAKSIEEAIKIIVKFMSLIKEKC